LICGNDTRTCGSNGGTCANILNSIIGGGAVKGIWNNESVIGIVKSSQHFSILTLQILLGEVLINLGSVNMVG